jgi:hypothetical protein
LSVINTDEVLPKPSKLDKRKDVAILDEPTKQRNETPERLSGCSDENFIIKVSKKKKRNQNKAQQPQTKNVAVNGIGNSNIVKNQAQTTTNNDPSPLSSVPKQEKKKSSKEAQLKQTKKEQSSTAMNQTHNRFSIKVGQSKPKR